MNRNCILCDADLTTLGSYEHIVPQSIGGRRRTKWSLCNRCNNEAGRTWDAELADSLLPFQQLVHEPEDDIRARRVTDPQTRQTFILNAGLRGAQAKPEVRRSTNGNKVTFETSAMTAAQAREALERALREEGFSRQAAKKEASKAVTERQLRKQFVEMNVVTSFGDGSVYSSIKSAVNAGVEAGLTGDEMERARRCLRGGHPGNHVMWIPAKPGIVQPRDLDGGQWCHTVGIRTDSEEKVVWGLCEWYGVVRLLMMLGTRYQGEVREWWYGVDGRTGQEVPVLIAEDKWRESVERARGPGFHCAGNGRRPAAKAETPSQASGVARTSADGLAKRTVPRDRARGGQRWRKPMGARRR